METTRLVSVRDTKANSFGIGKNMASVCQNGEGKKAKAKIDDLKRCGSFPAWNVGDKAIRLSNGSTYAEVETDGVIYHLRVTSPVGGRENAGSDEISIVSGPCLFGGRSVIATQADGRKVYVTDPEQAISGPVERLRALGRFSTYEVEYIYRMGSFIARYSSESLNVKKIHLNIPRFEYYLYVMPAYNAGQLAGEDVLDWFDRVDKRSAAVKAEIARVVRSEAPQCNAEFEDLMPLRRLGDEIRNSVCEGKKMDGGSMLNVLRQDRSTGTFWQKLLPFQSEPKDIAYASYVIAELIAASVDISGEKKLVAIMENPEEERIFRRLKDELCKFSSMRLSRTCGIYPQRNFINARNMAEASKDYELYFTFGRTDKATEDSIRRYYNIQDLELARQVL